MAMRVKQKGRLMKLYLMKQGQHFKKYVCYHIFGVKKLNTKISKYVLNKTVSNTETLEGSNLAKMKKFC